MLLILLAVTCLQGQPNVCSISGMKSFDVSNEGVLAACQAYLAPQDATHKRGLTVMYAQGLNVKMSNASGACVATPKNLPPAEYKKVFFENVWK